MRWKPSLRVILALALAVPACTGPGATPADGGAPGDDALPLDGRADAPLDQARAEDSGSADAPIDTAAADALVPPADAPDGSQAIDAGADGALPDVGRTLGALHCPPPATPYPDPFPADRTPQVVAIAPPGGISFLEGPVWLGDRGVLLLSEWNAGHRILQLTPPQTIEVFLPASRSNGLTVTHDGKSLLMVTEMPAASVSRLNLADKSVQALAQTFNGQGFVQPNDLAVRSDGTIYFTDYQAGRLYRRAVDGTLSLLSSLPRSNGVGLSPDEQTLYLNADTHTVKYPLAIDGTVGAGVDLATGLRGADGMAIDCAGNVYIAQNNGGALVVVSPTGNRLGELGGLPTTVTNAAFGGADRQTLYITTSSALYALRLLVPGLPS